MELVFLKFRIIVFGGCSCLMIQFAAAPKYALNTYAVVPADNFLMAVIFAAHEYLYMFHIWSHQASSIVLCEVFAHTYTEIIKEMTTVLERLIAQGKHVYVPEPLTSRHNSGNSYRESSSDYELRKRQSRRKNMRNRRMSDEEHLQRHIQISEETQAKITKRYLDPTTKVPGTEYDIMTLLNDYKSLMLATSAFNSWAGRLQGGTTGSNYGQFVSDVFMMIQLLKEPETDLMAVFFFMEVSYLDKCANI